MKTIVIKKGKSFFCKKVLMLCAFALCAVAITFGCCSLASSVASTGHSYADGSGTLGQVQWNLDEATGNLSLKPIPNTEGFLPEINSKEDVPWLTSSSADSKIRSISIEGTIKAQSALNYFFANTQIVTTTDLVHLDVSRTSSIHDCFSGCTNLYDLSGISHWETENFKHIQNLFMDCKELQTIEPLKFWNINNIQDLRGVFANCTKITSLDSLSGWEVHDVTRFDNAFYGLTKIENVDGLSDWDTSGATNMKAMFQNCSSLSDLNGIAGWNVAGVSNFESMFSGCSQIMSTSALSNWAPQAVTNVSKIFSGDALLANLDCFQNWKASVGTADASFNDKDAYAGCSALTSLNIGANFKITSNCGLRTQTSGAEEVQWCNYSNQTEFKTTTALCANNLRGRWQEANYASGAPVNPYKKPAESSIEATINKVEYVYTSIPIKLDASIAVDGVPLKENRDYVFSFTKQNSNGSIKPINAGTYTVEAQGIGAYEFTVSWPQNIRISPANLATDVEVLLAQNNLPFNGQAQTPEAAVKCNGIYQDVKLFNRRYANNTHAGNASLTVEALPNSNFLGSKTVNFAITPLALTEATVISTQQNYTYIGQDILPSQSHVKVEVNGIAIGNESFAIAPKTGVNYKNIGDKEYLIVSKDKADVTGQTSGTFTVVPFDLEKANIQVDDSTCSYSGLEVKPQANVTTTIAETVFTLPQTDFSYAYDNNINATTADKKATVTITPASPNIAQESKAVASFAIAPGNLKNAYITADEAEITFTGEQELPQVKIRFGGTPDYPYLNTDDYMCNPAAGDDCIGAGAHQAIVSAKGANVEGEAAVDFQITPANLAASKITLLGENPVYTGSPIEIEPSNLEVKVGENLILDSEEYAIEETSYSNNVNAGDASFTIFPNSSNVVGSRKGTFTIEAADMSLALVEVNPSSMVYDGSPLKPDNVSVLLDGFQLPAADYSVSYANNVDVGTAVVKASSKTKNVKGSVEGSFSITPTAELDSGEVFGGVSSDSGSGKSAYGDVTSDPDAGQALGTVAEAGDDGQGGRINVPLVVALSTGGIVAVGAGLYWFLTKKGIVKFPFKKAK